MNTIKYFSLLAIISLVACSKKVEQAPAGPQELAVVEVPQKTVTTYNEFPANIQGVNNNEVRAKIQGYIKEVYVDEGQYVTKGQALFRLETNVLSENVNASKSSVNASAASVSAAKASVQAAQVEVNKLIPLVEKKIISNVQLETAKASLAQAKAQLEQANANYAASKADLSGAQANVDYSIVRSPINGVVGSLNSRVGALVGPSDSTPITTVSETGQVYAYFTMNESEYFNFLEKAEGNSLKEKIAKFPKVELILANGQSYPEKGTLQTVTGQIDATTGTIKFRVSFQNKDHFLSNGNSGTIKIPITNTDVLLVPSVSTFNQQGISYVYVVKKDTAYSTAIDIKETTDNFSIVTKGVQKGDIIVAEGVNTLKNKTFIKPKKTVFDSIVKVKTVF